ncbi:MAG TPA: cytochrome c [Geminicoccaceae bacterium]|nr:cytochrome c [Geminicoccaceae bacterium]
MCRFVDLAAAALAGGLVLAVSPTSVAEAEAIEGERLFATSCGWCHQKGGRAAGKGPKLAGTERDDAYLIGRIKNGKAGKMPGFARTFSDEQIAAIVDYIRNLDGE